MKKLVALLLTFLLVLGGCKGVEVTKVENDVETDAIRFSKEYNLKDKETIYKYSTYDNIIDVIKNKTGIIYLGFPGCDLCKEIIPVLNDAAKENNIEKIYYYNFKEIRENNTKEYIFLLNLINDYIMQDQNGNKKITAPTIIFVNNGNIIGVYIGTMSSNPEEIITEEEKESLKNNFKSLINKMLISESQLETNEEENLGE